MYLEQLTLVIPLHIRISLTHQQDRLGETDLTSPDASLKLYYRSHHHKMAHQDLLPDHRLALQ